MIAGAGVGPGRANGALIRAFNEFESLAMFLLRVCRELVDDGILPIVLSSSPSLISGLAFLGLGESLSSVVRGSLS